MYELRSRIKFSEIDKTGRLSMDGLLRLFQDIGYLHAQDRNLGLEFTEKTRKTWYLLSWQIHKINMPMVGEEIVIKTAIYDVRGSLAKKSLIMENMNGDILACGDTMWAYVDIDMEMPVEADLEVWPESDFGERNKIIPVLSRRINIGSDGVTGEGIKITDRFLDTNNHANNVRLTELAMDVSGVFDMDCRVLRAEFKRQVKGGSMVLPYICQDNGKYTVALKSDAGENLSVFYFEAN